MSQVEGSLLKSPPKKFYPNAAHKVILDICRQERPDGDRLVFKSGIFGGCLFSAAVDWEAGSRNVVTMSAETDYCCSGACSKCDDLSVEAATASKRKGSSIFHKYRDVVQDAMQTEVKVKDVFKTYLTFLRDGVQSVVNGKRAKTIVWNKGTPTIKYQNDQQNSSNQKDVYFEEQNRGIDSRSEFIEGSRCEDIVGNKCHFDALPRNRQDEQLDWNDVPHDLDVSAEHLDIPEFRTVVRYEEDDLDFPRKEEYSEIDDLSVDQFPHVVSYVRDSDALRSVRTACFRSRGFADDNVSIPRRSVSLINLYAGPYSEESVSEWEDFDKEPERTGRGCVKQAITFPNREKLVGSPFGDSTIVENPPPSEKENPKSSTERPVDRIAAYYSSPLDFTCQDSKCGPPGCEGQRCVPCEAHSTDDAGDPGKPAFYTSIKEDVQKLWTNWMEQLYGLEEKKPSG